MKDFRELQNKMLSVTHDLEGIYSEYVHPGFGNVDSPDVVVFDEAPSLGHFTNFSEDIRSMDIAEYVDHFERKYRDRVLDWPPFEEFLQPVFGEFDLSRDGLLNEIYLTSLVKNPVERENKSTNLRKAYTEIWRPYIKEELDLLKPEIIITAGCPASQWISQLLGIPSNDARSISISKEQWWGLSPFDARTPLIYAPHWSAKSYDSELKRNWVNVLNSVVEGLNSCGYTH